MIPTEWHEAYSMIYGNNLDWVIAGFMQNALLNNGPGGERKPWKSK